MDSAGFEQAHLVGNSLGGWLALQLAALGFLLVHWVAFAREAKGRDPTSKGLPNLALKSLLLASRPPSVPS